MNRFWEHVLLPLAQAAEARTFCEIGSDRGYLTEKILAHCAEIAGVVHVIDPSPAYDPEEYRKLHGDRFVFHQALSLDALPSVGPVDFVVIDGDHNWYTVLNELRLIERVTQEHDAVLPVIAMHDVGWPYARRDLYYDPDSIPKAHRRPHERKGVHPDSAELVDRGLNPHLHNAISEGTEANGVLTAVEDYLAETSIPWRFRTLGGLSGVGLLVDESRATRQPEVARALRRLGSPATLRRHLDAVERARILAEIRATTQSRRVRELRARAERLVQQVREAQDGGGADEEPAARTRLEAELADVRGQLREEARARLDAERARDEALRASQAAAAETIRANAARDQQGIRADETSAALGRAHELLESSRREHREAAVDAARAEAHREHFERWASELRGELAQANAAQDALREQHRGAEARAAQAVAERDEAARRLEQLVGQIDQRDEELDLARTEREATWEEQVTAARGKLEQLGDELELRRRERDAAGLAAAQAEAQRDELAQRLTQAQDALGHRTREVERLLDHQGTLERDSLETTRRLEGELGRVTKAYDDAIDRERALRQRLIEGRDESERRLEAERQRADGLESALQAARAAAPRADDAAELERLREESDRLQFGLDREQAVRSVLDEHISALREQITEGAPPPADDAQALDPEAPVAAAAPLPAPVETAPLRPPTVRSLTRQELAVRETFATRYQELLGGMGLTGLADEDLAAPWPVFTEPQAGWTARVSIIVCVHNALEDLRRCLGSVATHLTDDAEVILVDDGSDVPTANFLDRVARVSGRVRLVRNDTPPHGYTVAANLGLKAARGEYLVLLNSDTIVTAGWMERIIACGDQDADVGILGPVSNAASHQSVPRIRDGGSWATNPLPPWLTVDGMGVAISAASAREHPHVPFVNGFCYAIKRHVLDAVGYLDEETFGGGYCEENDYSLRALQAGFVGAVVDDAFVYHAKSRSYTEAGRNEHAKRNYQRFVQKHGAQTVTPLVRQLEQQDPVGALGRRVRATLEDPRRLVETVQEQLGCPVSPAFVLPGIAAGGSGGSHSIVQEVGGMRALGVPARIAVPTSAMERIRAVYHDRLELFMPYEDEGDLAEVTEGSEVLVATHFTSVKLVQRLLERRPDCIAAYYVQDYEPFFAAPGSASAQAAYESYTAIPEQLLFAKTHWLRNIVSAAHGVRVAKVEPSIDQEVYRPTDTRGPDAGPIVVSAMVRPRTPRRQPGATLRLLERLEHQFGDRVEIVTFGCDQRSVDALTDSSGIRSRHAGVISRYSVADLLGRSHVFVDLSTYQAFGRTALEAMACGCVPIVPMSGGAWEFAVPDVNAVLVDTCDDQACLTAATRLVEDGDFRRRLQEAGRDAASRYSIERAALSEFAIFAAAMLRARLSAPGRRVGVAAQ